MKIKEPNVNKNAEAFYGVSVVRRSHSPTVFRQSSDEHNHTGWEKLMTLADDPEFLQPGWGVFRNNEHPATTTT